MGRIIIDGIEFIFKGDKDEFLNQTNVVYELANSLLFMYIGEVSEGKYKTYTLGKRLTGHAHKISIGSEEDIYKNGLGKTKRIYVRVIKKCKTPEEARLCEHNTIVQTRMKIAKSRGFDVSYNEARKGKNSYIWSDILLNVLS